MEQQVNNSLWALSRKSEPISNILIGEQKADVVIIGGGFTGLSAALTLSEAGTNVIVLEAKFNGFGGSGRNVGLTNAGLWLKPEEVESRLGQKYGRRLNSFLSVAPDLVHNIISDHHIDCEANRNGTLYLAHSKAGLNSIEKCAWQMNERGARVMLLDQDATFNLTAAKGYLGALHDMRAGTIQPLEYCHGLSIAAQKTGADIYTRSPATNIYRENGKWNIKTPKGKVIADQVFMATNAYIENILPELKAEYTPMYYCQMATDPLSKAQLEHFLPNKNGTWDTRMVMRSYRTDQAGRLIIGTIGNIYKNDAPLLQSWANKMVRDTFPKVGPVKWTYKWAGRIACSQNYIPNIHDFGSGLYSCGGYSGRGIAPGTAFGRLMANYILGSVKESEMPLPFTPVKAVPFNKLRELFFETGSQLSRVYDHI